jgi:hypothetical protein
MSFARPRNSDQKKKGKNMTSYVDNKIEMLKQRIRKSRDRTKALLQDKTFSPSSPTFSTSNALTSPPPTTNKTDTTPIISSITSNTTTTPMATQSNDEIENISSRKKLKMPIMTTPKKSDDDDDDTAMMKTPSPLSSSQLTRGLTPSLRRRIEIARDGEAMSALRESSEMVKNGRVDFDVLCHVLKHDIKDLTFSEIARLHEAANVDEESNKVNLKAFCSLVFGDDEPLPPKQQQQQQESSRKPPSSKKQRQQRQRKRTQQQQQFKKKQPHPSNKKKKKRNTKSTRKDQTKNNTLANSNSTFKRSLRSSKTQRVMHFGSYKRHLNVDELRKMVRNKLRAQSYDGGYAKGNQSSSWQDRLHREFEQFDVNHDGILSFQELTHAIRRLVPVSLDEIRTLLHDFDENGDGTVEYAEFVDFVEGKPPPGLTGNDDDDDDDDDGDDVMAETPTTPSSPIRLTNNNGVADEGPPTPGHHPPGITVVSSPTITTTTTTTTPTKKNKASPRHVDELLESITEQEKKIEMSLENMFPSKNDDDDDDDDDFQNVCEEEETNEEFEPFPTRSNSNSPTHHHQTTTTTKTTTTTTKKMGPVESLLTSIAISEEEELEQERARRVERSEEIEEEAARLALQVKNLERKIVDLRGDNRRLQRGGGRNFVTIFDRYEERISRLENDLRDAREESTTTKNTTANIKNKKRKSEISHLRDLTARQKQEIGSLHERLSKWEKRGRQHQIRARMLRDALDKLTKSRQRTTAIRSRLADRERTIREIEHRVSRSNVLELNLQGRVSVLEDERKGMLEEIKMLREQLHEDSDRVYESNICKHFGLRERRKYSSENTRLEDEDERKSNKREWGVTLRKTLRKLEKVLRLHRPRALSVLTCLLDEIHKLHEARDDALEMEQQAVDILVDIVKDGGGLKNVHRLMKLHARRSER